jgi:hypothetical protein
MQRKMAQVRKLHSKKINYRIHCIECGELVTHEDDIGMWCDNRCGRRKAIYKKRSFDKMMEKMQNFGAPKEEE